MAAYDAFISYGHANDKPIAAALQSVIQKLGKPWYRRRALRVFRDDTSLSSTPHLWPSIEAALNQSRYFILLASPEAAASNWVNREVAHWLDRNSVNTLLIAITDGALSWFEVDGDFIWHEGIPLPPVLKGRFSSEPKFVDLHGYRNGADRGDAKFTELAADLAAAIRGMPKEDLLSQVVRQQRRALTLAWSAAASQLVTTGVAGWQKFTELAADLAAAIRGMPKEDLLSQVVRQQRRALTLAWSAAASRLVTTGVAGWQKFTELAADLAAAIRGMPKEDLLSQVVRQQRRALTLAWSAAASLLVTTGVAGWQKFTELAADLAAAIRGIPKEDLLSQVVRQQRRALTLAWSAAASLLVTTGVAGWQWNAAVRSERLALAETARAERNFDAAKSTISTVMVDLVSALSDVEGMQVETARRVLGRVENAMGKLTSQIENNPDIQRSQAAMFAFFAETYTRQGEIPLALEYARKSVGLYRELVDRGAATKWGWQDINVDLAASLYFLGDILKIQRDIAGWLEAARESLDIRRALVTKDPHNKRSQEILSRGLIFFGEALRANNDLDGALVAYQEATEIARALVAEHSTNSDRQRLLSISLERIGVVLYDRKNFTAALVYFQETLDIARELVAKDPANFEWRADLAASLEYVGDALRAEGDVTGATAAYHEGLDIRHNLAGADPSNSKWQTNVVLLLVRLAWAGDDPRARYSEALDILRPLSANGRLQQAQQGWVAEIERELAMLPKEQVYAR